MDRIVLRMNGIPHKDDIKAAQSSRVRELVMVEFGANSQLLPSLSNCICFIPTSPTMIMITRKSRVHVSRQVVEPTF